MTNKFGACVLCFSSFRPSYRDLKYSSKMWDKDLTPEQLYKISFFH